MRAFNVAVRGEVPFDPYTRDGRGTVGLEPAKSNWANPIDQPSYERTPGASWPVRSTYSM